MSLRIIALLFLFFTEIRVINKAAMIMCVLSPNNSESLHHCHLFWELCCVYVTVSGSEKLFIEDGALQLKQGHRFPSGKHNYECFQTSQWHVICEPTPLAPPNQRYLSHLPYAPSSRWSTGSSRGAQEGNQGICRINTGGEDSSCHLGSFYHWLLKAI